jgi:hypothetical protein
MAAMQPPELDAVARDALTIGDVQSAAIFVVGTAGALELAAAAGIDGAPLAGLVAAVQQAGHPVARAVHDPGPTFDVTPMNPGGPSLRSHLPLRAEGEPSRTLGVLALAHDQPLGPTEQARAVALGHEAGRALADRAASQR